MFRRSAWRLAASAKAAAEPSLHTIQVSKAQGIAKGLTGGTSQPLGPLERSVLTQIRARQPSETRLSSA